MSKIRGFSGTCGARPPILRICNLLFYKRLCFGTVDMVGVTGSIPVLPTTRCRRPDATSGFLSDVTPDPRRFHLQLIMKRVRPALFPDS